VSDGVHLGWVRRVSPFILGWQRVSPFILGAEQVVLDAKSQPLLLMM
jgi:hypothetical protein